MSVPIAPSSAWAPRCSRILKRPMTMSRLWDEVRGRRSLHAPNAPIDYQWFILSLDLLYTIGALDFDRGLVRRVAP